MSIGYEGRLILDTLDEKQVIYNYACGNLNKGLDIYYTDRANPDGRIVIDRSCFVESEIRQKRKKIPSGKKRMVTKRIIKPVDYRSYIEEGLIKIKNASACWRETEGIDFMALRLLFKLFNEYQEKGEIPETISIFW